MARYFLVRGKPDVLGPSIGGDGRSFPGKRRLSGEERQALTQQLRRPLEFVEQFGDVEQVVPEERGILKAIQHGELEKLAGPVVADSIGQAREMLAAPKPAASKPAAKARE